MLDSQAEAEKAVLDVSINGQNYAGNLEFTFLKPLRIHRDVPMAWTNSRRLTEVKAIGQGYRLKNGEQSYIKWGVRYTDPINATSVVDYTYKYDEFLQTVPGSSELKAYFEDL